MKHKYEFTAIQLGISGMRFHWTCAMLENLFNTRTLIGVNVVQVEY